MQFWWDVRFHLPQDEECLFRGLSFGLISLVNIYTGTLCICFRCKHCCSHWIWKGTDLGATYIFAHLIHRLLKILSIFRFFCPLLLNCTELWLRYYLMTVITQYLYFAGWPLKCLMNIQVLYWELLEAFILFHLPKKLANGVLCSILLLRRGWREGSFWLICFWIKMHSMSKWPTFSLIFLGPSGTV